MVVLVQPARRVAGTSGKDVFRCQGLGGVSRGAAQARAALLCAPALLLSLYLFQPPLNISFPNSHSLGPLFLAQSVGFQERIEHDEFTVLD